MSWSFDAHDLDLLAVEADERLLTEIAARMQAARPHSDAAIGLLSALAIDVDARPIPGGRLIAGNTNGDSTSSIAGAVSVRRPSPTDRPRSNRRRTTAAGLAAAAALLSAGGAAAAVTAAPFASTIKETVRSLFDHESEPSRAQVIGAKLASANAALARGDIFEAQRILDDIHATVEQSDPDEVPASLVAQIEQLEAKVEVATYPRGPQISPPLPSPLADGSGGDQEHESSDQIGAESIEPGEDGTSYQDQTGDYGGSDGEQSPDAGSSSDPAGDDPTATPTSDPSSAPTGDDGLSPTPTPAGSPTAAVSPPPTPQPTASASMSADAVAAPDPPTPATDSGSGGLAHRPQLGDDEANSSQEGTEP